MEAALADLSALEDFFAFPGPRLMKALGERISSDDALGVARMVRRLSGALLSESYRYDSGEWETAEDAGDADPERLSTALGDGESYRPYFETLFVTPAPAASRVKIAHEIRSLRRVEDAMIYEPVLVGSVEDALLAVILNPKIQAVVIFDGIPVPSQHDVPLLRDLLTTQHQLDASSAAPREIGVSLARAHQARPPRARHLPDDRPAGGEARGRSRGLDDPARVLRGRGADGGASQRSRRCRRPLFHAAFRQPEALRRPADRHVPRAADRARQVDHEIELDSRHGRVLRTEPVPRGNLGHNRRPRQHARADRNIKVAQEKFARAVGADHVFFVTNGTSTSNKMVYQAVTAPGDIVIADRNCHKSHHYGMVLSGAQPLYVEAFPMTEYSMYGAVPLRTIKQALLDLKAEGRLDRVKMVTLTNCTFDGHVYNTRRVMEECLAIKPDLIFLWDEAWFGFARWSPFLRQRTAMGAAAALEEWRKSPAAKAAWDSASGRTRRGPRSEGCAPARSASGSGSAQDAHPRLRDQLGAQVHVGAATGLDRRGSRRGLQPPRLGLPRGGVYPRFDVAERADHRLAGRSPAPDGARGLRTRHARDRDRACDPAGRSRNTRSSRSTSACSAPMPWCRQSFASRVSATSSLLAAPGGRR